MKKIELVRINANKPEFNKIDEMLQFFNEIQEIEMNTVPKKELKDLVNQIIDFQDEDGSFKLVDSFKIESDCRVAYCYFPTYLGAAFLMKALQFDESLLAGKEEVLTKALKSSMGRGLTGHGFDLTTGQIEALNVFIKAEVKEFTKKYSYICPEFCEMIMDIAKEYRKLLEEGRVCGPWGESYEEEFKRIVNELLDETEYYNIFVYGTLLKGQSNYERFLSPAKPLMRADIEGYKMFDIGCFPGIVEGEGKVKGEIYRVDREKLEEIDRLEGEGYLYKRVKVNAESYSVFEKVPEEVYVYVYNRETSGLEEISYDAQPYKNEYVWYVSYGSNMLAERFEAYICGEYCRMNGKEYAPCEDDELLYESVLVELPYTMYYSNYNMGSWENSAVSFLDVNEFGTSYGRAYLIKKSQLEHIHKSEGKSSNWYPDIVELEEIEGIKAYTFTNKNTKKHEPISKISGAYFSTLLEGLVEAGLSTEDAYEYLFSCASEYGETSWAGYGKYRNSHYNNHKHMAELHY